MHINMMLMRCFNKTVQCNTEGVTRVSLVVLRRSFPACTIAGHARPSCCHPRVRSRPLMPPRIAPCVVGLFFYVVKVLLNQVNRERYINN